MRVRLHNRDAGFSLSALIFFLTAASILASVAIPAYKLQARRDQEAELIFRGAEYTRAIQKYQRKFGVYPTAIDQLVETNGIRFVRRQYTDPINGKEFRLIFINPDGSLTGSVLFNTTINNPSMFGGNTSSFGNMQAPGGNNNNNNNNNRQGNNQTNLNTPGFGNSGIGNTPTQGNNTRQGNVQTPTGLGAAPGIGNTPSFGNAPGAGNARNVQIGGNGQVTANGQTPGNNQTAGNNRQGATQGNTQGNQPISSGGLIGVASDSDLESLMVYNQRQKYREWEFIAIMNQQNPQGQNQNGQNTNGQNGQNPNGQNPNGQNNPFGNNSNSFTPRSPTATPGGNPFGTQGQPAPNPFGFGGNNNTVQPNQPNPQNPPIKR